MQVPETLNFWIKQISKQTELAQVFIDSADERAKLWKKALPYTKPSAIEKKKLQAWAETLRQATALDSQVVAEFLNLLLVARVWTLAGGALDLYASQAYFAKLSPTDHTKLWQAVARLEGLSQKADFIWLAESSAVADAWKKFFVQNQADQYKNFSDKNYTKLVEHLMVVDENLEKNEKSLNFSKFFEAHASELSSEQLHILSEKLDLLENVTKYLIAVPEGDNYSDLRFHQNLVIKHFQPEKIILTPEKSEGPLLGAFWEYKSIYTERYLTDHERYYEEARQYLKTAKQRTKKLRALKNLDNIKELGAPCYERLAKLETEFGHIHTSCPLEESDKLLKILENNSAVCPECGFQIGQTFPVTKYDRYEKEINDAIDTKINNLRNKGIEEIMRDDTNDNMRKLIELIHLADFDKIIDLLASDKSNQISKALQKIFKK